MSRLKSIGVAACAMKGKAAKPINRKERKERRELKKEHDGCNRSAAPEASNLLVILSECEGSLFSCPRSNVRGVTDRFGSRATKERCDPSRSLRMTKGGNMRDGKRREF